MYILSSGFVSFALFCMIILSSYDITVENTTVNSAFIYLVEQISKLRERGQQFLEVPDSYYDNLRKRLKNSPVCVEEDMDKVCLLLLV